MIRSCLAAALLIASSLASTGAIASKEGSAADIAAVRAVGETWRAHYASGNYAAIPDLYTEDTLVLPRGRPAVVGREAMRRAIGGLAAGRKVDIDLQEREIVVAGDYAWYVGDFRVTYTPPDPRTPPRTEHARSLVIFKRGEDGAWRVHRDIDSPAPAPAADAAAAAAAPAAKASAKAPRVWDPDSRREATACDRLASSRYDRTRLAEPVARKDIDVPAAIAQCEADLARFPDDARIHFHLGRLYGYAGDGARTLQHRQAAAAAGNHNAIFLLGYLGWIGAANDAARCEAAGQMRLAADRGNYSAQIAYSTFFVEGRLASCADTPAKPVFTGYVRAARPAVDGFFETLLAEHLLTELQ